MGFSPPLFLLVVFWVASFCPHDGRTGVSPSPLRLKGDYMLAGLFQIQKTNLTDSPRQKPEVDICQMMNNPRNHSYHLIQALRLAVGEVNNSSDLLPNVTLGYEIYDTCSLSAAVHATLSLLAQQGGHCTHEQHIAIATNYTSYLPKVVAAIGPDSSEYALLTASLLGVFLLPEISYEASSPVLSMKRSYPSFLRTIPSDKVQADALIHLLQAFRWSWVSLVSSDNSYGTQGQRMLHEAAARVGICFAYQGVIPKDQGVSGAELAGLVQAVAQSGANVAVVFANKQSVLVFFPEVLRQNVTGKVWLGTEDWMLSTEVWNIPGIHSLSTVMGMVLRQAHVPGLEALAELQDTRPCLEGPASCQPCKEACGLGSPAVFRRQSQHDPSPYDMQGASNVYAAVFAVAHGLHRLLRCQGGTCRKDTIYPWQLLQEVKQVNFTLNDRRVSFDPKGNSLGGYDLVLWKWVGGTWNYSVVGSYDRNPDRLNISRGRLPWKAGQIPVSVCSKECEEGEQKVPQGAHPCCFHCVPCPPGTFLNTSDPYACQKCQEDQWSSSKSNTCFNRATLFLSWDDNLSLALLVANTLLFLLVVGTTGVFLKNLDTPVVRSAGGWLCFAILGSLACASLSIYCYFGVPNRVTCLLRPTVYPVSITLCLACMIARSVQIVLIFKMTSKAPGLLGTCQKQHGPRLLIGAIVGLQSLMVLTSLTFGIPAPFKNYHIADQLTVLDCTQHNTVVPVCMLAYNCCLALACFSISYMGKDLPNSYSEAKCITLSLLIYFVSLIAYVTTLRVYQGTYLVSMYLASLLFTLSGIFGSYFGPKAYVILFRPMRNTTEYFQMSIQSYTTRRNTDR